MRTLAFFRLLERSAGRFNRWFGGTALAAGAEQQTSLGPQIDPLHVTALLGDIDKNESTEEDDRT